MSEIIPPKCVKDSGDTCASDSKNISFKIASEHTISSISLYFCSSRHMANDFYSPSVAKERTVKYKFNEAKQLILPYILTPTLFCS